MTPNIRHCRTGMVNFPVVTGARLFTIFTLICSAAHAAFTVGDLRCEYRTDPMGVDSAKPRLSWVLQSGEQGQKQTAYQVLAASSRAFLDQDRGDLWDSGQANSDDTIQIPYGGAALKSSQQVFWKVRSWDKDGKPSPWSAAGTWTMGLMSDSDWIAHWIAAPAELNAPPTIVLRREFDVKPQLRRAIAYVCGLGQYEMSVNGRKAGEDLLTPGWTLYTKTCLYDTYDITALLKSGSNSVEMLLGNGMYNVMGGRYTKFKRSFGPLKAIAQIRLEYEDGSIQTVGTDDAWKVAGGPITFSCVYGGEDFDARLVDPDISKWSVAAVVEGPGGKLRGLSCAAPPIRVIDVLKPVATHEIREGVSVYDLGQNTSIMIRMKVHGPAGSSVKITPAELVRPDGSVNRGSCGGGEAYWKYTLAGTSGGEDYRSRFFYHGCRYLQVETSGDAVVDQLEALIVHSISEPIGEFSCSNELFNRIRTLVRWAQRSNMASVLSDCPHRERLGWLEQDYLNGPSLRYEWDLAQFFTKVMNDISDSQAEDGLVPDIAPEYPVFKGGFRDSPEWGSAFVLCALQQYQWTGDVDLLRRHYDGMKRYVMYLDSKSTMGIVNHGLGDWYDLGPRRPGTVQLTPTSLTATATYYGDLLAMEKIARRLGNDADADEFSKMARQVRSEFNRTLLNDDSHLYATGSQTSGAMPLAMGLVDPGNQQNVLDAIVADIRKHDNGVTAGDIGYRYLLRALAENGRSDVIFDMNNQSDRPGYGFQLKRGATSLTEGWGGTGSQNHFMLGQITEWFYHDLAGIQPDPAGPGFKKIIIKPAVVGDLTRVKASFRSVRGTIRSEWKRDGNAFTLHVTIPPNTTASIFLPGRADPQQVESGDHSFASALPATQPANTP
jgi:hypothetical protein